MPSTKPTVGLLFDIEALNRQSEINRKQAQKRRVEAKKQEFLQEQANKVESKIKRKNSRGKDLISKRRAAQLAQMKRAAKMALKKAGATQEGEEVELVEDSLGLEEIEELAKLFPEKNVNPAEKTTIADKAENIFADLNPEKIADVIQEMVAIKEKAEIESWPELELDLSPDKSILDQLLDPKNLMGSTATSEELAEAKSVAKLISRFARQMMKNSMPTVLDAVAKGLANEGIDLTDPEMNPYLKDESGEFVNPNPKPMFLGKAFNSKYFEVPNQANPDAKVSIDHSIFASVFKAIEINQLLQELGIESDIIASKVQNEMSKELLEEAEVQYKKNAKAIKKAHEQKCMAQALRIIGDTIGAMFIWMGMPYIGVPLILAAEGQIKKMIEAMAKAFGVPEYAIQSTITAIATTIAIAVSVASIWVPGINAAVISAAWSAAIFVAGTAGWFETTIGAIATGQLDPAKFPGWVTWAAMGVELALTLAAMYQSVLSALRTIAKTVANLPSNLAKLGTKLASWGSQLSTKVSSVPGLLRTGIGAMESMGPKISSLARSAISSLRSFSAAGAIGRMGNVMSSVATTVQTRFSQFVRYVKEMAERFMAKLEQVMDKIASKVRGVGQNGGSGGAVGNGAASSSGGVPSSSTATSGVSSGQGMAGGGMPSSSTTAAGGPPSQAAATAKSTQAAEEMAKASDSIQGISAAPMTPASTATQAVEMMQKAERGVLTKLQEILNQLSEKIEYLIKKLLEKLYQLKDWSLGADTAASQLSGAMKGAATAAERAEKLFNAIKRLIRLSQKVAKWLMLAAQGAQSAVQIEMGKIQMEMGEILEEAAELAGEVTLLQQFLKSINLSVRSLQQSKRQYAQDSADQIEKLGSILTSQRRNENLLMSA